MKTRYLFIILFAFFAVGGVVLADIPAEKLPPSQYRLPFTGIPTQGEAVLDLINLVASWVFAIFVAVSIIFIVMGAFEFVTAQGDPAKITKARQSLIYAVIGIVLALIAVGLPFVIRNIVVGSSTSQTQDCTNAEEAMGLCTK
ncbi:MAG: hypothetical protein HYW97_02095 [Candidatus Wildermuthbacteria bacterium]|nr:hypothetical protein [Candidatus Wildermuthbacteria bacterium]